MPLQFLSRRQLTSSMALAGTLMALSPLRAQSKLEKSRLVVAVDGKAAFSYLPLTLAEQLGYFRAEGLDIQIIDYPDPAAAAQAVLSGAADVCAGSFERCLQLQAKTTMVKAFVLLARTPQMAFGISTRSLPLYATASDLKGKKLGVTALDSSASVMANLLLRKGGLQAHDVSWVPVGLSANAAGALRSGAIDALCSSDPAMTMLEQKGEVKIISDTRTLKGTAELFGGLMPSACLYAPSEFVDKNAKTCQALVHAIVHSLKWLQTAGPGDIINNLPESYLLGDRGLYLASFNKIRESISPDGMLPDEALSTALRALVQIDPALRLARIDVAKAYTNDFVRKAKIRLGV